MAVSNGSGQTDAGFLDVLEAKLRAPEGKFTGAQLMRLAALAGEPMPEVKPNEYYTPARNIANVLMRARRNLKGVGTSVRRSEFRTPEVTHHGGIAYVDATTLVIERPPGFETDLAFIGYCEIHCETERKLFSGKQIKYLAKLAGLPVSTQLSDEQFVPLDEDECKTACKLAREALSGRPPLELDFTSSPSLKKTGVVVDMFKWKAQRDGQ